MKRTYSSPKIRKIALRSMSCLLGNSDQSQIRMGGEANLNEEILSNERSASDNIWGED